MASATISDPTQKELSKERRPIDGADGYTAHAIFRQNVFRQGFTYDDIILMPGQKVFDSRNISLETKLTRNIVLQLPLVSSPMDTVTEHAMAIEMALQGGIGIIHYNMTLEDQVREVKLVKMFRNGFIADPRVLSPQHTLMDVDKIKADCGFSGIPITTDGKLGSKLVGVVTNRDIDFYEDRSIKIEKVMSTDLVTGEERCTLKEAHRILKESKKGKLPIVNSRGELVSLISRADLSNARDYPRASKDKNEQLLVGAAIGTRPNDKDRCKALVEAGVNVIVIDSSQGDSMYQHDMIKWIKSNFEVDVIAGNIVTSTQAIHLIKAGADALKVGMGVGSICTTQEVCAVGRAQASSVYNTSRIGRKYGVPIIADGGISRSGHIVKALSLGASVAMCGSLFAGTEEAPGQYFFQDGMRLKKYRGMGSIEAMTKGSATRYFAQTSNVRVAQGVSGSVVDKGSLKKFIPYLVNGIQSGLMDAGARTVQDLHSALDEGKLRFELRTPAAQREGKIHSLHSYEMRGLQKTLRI